MLVLYAIDVGALALLAAASRDEFHRSLFWTLAFGMALVIPSFLLLVAVHEGGHALFARVMGMDVWGFCVGPFRWMKSGLGWRFSWHDDVRLGGFAIPAQRQPEFDRRQYLWMYLGGPIGSVLCVMVAVVLLALVPDQRPLLLGLVAFSSVFLLNVVPFRRAGVSTDGYWIVALLFKPKEAEARLAPARLQALALQDVPAAEWPSEIVALLAGSQGDTIEAIGARLYEVSFAFAKEDWKAAASAIESAQATLDRADVADPTGTMKAAVHLDSALYKAVVDRDPASARQSLARAGNVPVQLKFLEHEVMAFVFELEGERAKSLQAVQDSIVAARALLNDRPCTLKTFSEFLSRVSSDAPHVIAIALSGKQE